MLSRRQLQGFVMRGRRFELDAFSFVTPSLPHLFQLGLVKNWKWLWRIFIAPYQPNLNE